MDIFVEKLFFDQRKLFIPGFLIRSTAPINVEDEAVKQIDRDQPTLQDVVECLYQNSKTGQDLGVVIAIHGYNTGAAAEGDRDGVQESWYQPLCMYANEDVAIQKKRDKAIFLGYRWPSESLAKPGMRREAYKALPFLMSVLAVGGLGGATAASVAFALTRMIVFVAFIALGSIGFSVILSLYLLRISVYFRDSYRASQFGVPDLVELIRQLDRGLVQRKMRDALSDEVLYDRICSRIPEAKEMSKELLLLIAKTIDQELQKKPDLEIDPADLKFQWFLQKLKVALPVQLTDEFLIQLIERWVLIRGMENDAALRYWQKRPIQLSFIGHSMGAQVTTQVIRILSDVFDSRSVGSMGNSRAEKSPSSRVGQVFRLGRLVLVAPDIPLLTITSGRSNFLRSALRRFEEAYLFSNEGDLALRMASTSANYFSFPAKTRAQGYRLGNVTVSPKGDLRFKSRKNRDVYGILNREEMTDPNSHLLSYLEVSVLNKDRNQKLDPTSQKQEGEDSVATEVEDDESIADLFTFFDCTEYCDRTDYNPEAQKTTANVLVLKGQKSPLNLMNYLGLFIGFATFSPRKFPDTGRDGHGGYFHGSFSKLLIYRLAFLGLQGLLDSLIFTTWQQLDLPTAPPQNLLDELEQVQSLERTTGIITAPKGDPTLLDENRQTQLQLKRRVALDYLSWICAQKQIQAVLSPERYQVDILGRDRDDVREGLLMRNTSANLL
jgi:pimeloyl-ACP methyl ester carboxylesterase